MLSNEFFNIATDKQLNEVFGSESENENSESSEVNQILAEFGF